MGTIGESLATKFEVTNQEIIKTVESASDDQWGRVTAAEGWPAGVALHHIAESYGGLTFMVQAIATGAEMPAFTPEMLNQGNAEHAVRAATATKAETVQLLQNSGKAAAEMLRSLSDEQFAKSASMPLLGGAEMSAHQLAEGVLVGHGAGHLQGVKAAIE